MIKTLIFDVYGTIIAFERGRNAETVRGFMRRAGTETPKEEVHRLWGEYYRAAELDEENFRTEAQIFQDRIAWLYERYGCKADPKEAYSATSAISERRTAYPEAKAAIARLREKYRVVAGSNADNFPLRLNLGDAGIEMDAYYTSEELRIYKPRPEFYKKILEAEGLRPEEAVFIGDSPLEDVQAPRRLGLHAVWVNRDGRSGQAERSGRSRHSEQSGQSRQAERSGRSEPCLKGAEVKGLDELEEAIKNL